MIGLVLIFIATVLLIYYSTKSIFTDDDNDLEFDNKKIIADDYKPFKYDDNNKPKGFDNSYALADRIENLIYSRGITEQHLANEIKVAPSDIYKYEHMKGSPPGYIVDRIEEYFNVSFEFLADCKGNTLTVYRNGKLLYSQKYNYPHKARFDRNGFCIFLDSIDNSKYEKLYHLDPIGNIRGTFSNFPSGHIRYVKIADNGLNALLVSEHNRIFLIDLINYVITLSKVLQFHDFNIKDITDDELIFRFRCAGDMIDFSLDYKGNLYNASDLADYFIEKKPPIRYHYNGYVLITNYLLNNFSDNENRIRSLYGYITRPTSRKYISANKISAISKKIGKGYYENEDYEQSYEFFQKALKDNPKIAVKSYMNKLEKVYINQKQNRKEKQK